MPDRLYLEITYYNTFGRPLNLKNPTRYTEKIQWLKLYDRNPLYPSFVDKAEVKHHVEKLIGKEHVIPTLGVWNSTREIDWDALPSRFALKCTHDSGSYVICHDKETLDREAACKKLDAALKVNYYESMREWVYKTIPPRIIAESYLDASPNDYKFFCCHGEPVLMFVASDRLSEKESTKFDFFDIRGDKWEHLDIRNGYPNAAVEPQKPLLFDRMKELASILAQGLPHVRIDLYEIDGKIYFGEYTFYHWGGFKPFEPDSADELVGRMFKLPKKK